MKTLVRATWIALVSSAPLLVSPSHLAANPARDAAKGIRAAAAGVTATHAAVSHLPGILKREPFEVKDDSGRVYAAERCRLVVPERRDQPQGNTITLAFIRIKSTSAHPGSPIVYLEGGPGQPATPQAEDPASVGVWAPFLALGDVILLDQRGSGASEPSLAWTPSESLPLDFFADYAVALRTARKMQRSMREQFERQGVDLSSYNTEESAADVDAVRQALGASKIRTIGFSYGTTLSLAVIRRFGARVERAVLIGTDGPDHWGSRPTTLETQLRKISALAARDSTVNHAVPDVRALFARLLDRYEREPLRVPITDRRTGAKVTALLGRWGLEFLLRIDLGDGNDIPFFPALLWTLDQGRTDLVGRIVERRYNQIGGSGSAMSSTMTLSAWPPAWLVDRFQAERDSTLFRDVANYFDLELRDSWRLRPLPDAYRTPIVTELPALFVSGTLDSNAPPYQAEEIRWGFLDGTHLIVENAGHEDLLPSPEVRDVMLRFLRGEDVRASRVAFPRISFIGIKKKT